MKNIIYAIIASLCACISCSEKQGYKNALLQAEAVMKDNPDSALSILDSLGIYRNDFDDLFRMRYMLHLTNARNKANFSFKTDSIANELVRYFDDKGTMNERILAHYLQGRALSDMGETPEALQAYYDALAITDTSDKKCDFNTLSAIYGQMSEIFHKQNLPHDEIWAIKHYIKTISKVGDSVDYIIAKSQLVRPYFLLGKTDSIIQIINDTYNAFRELGDEQRAAESLASVIYIYTEKGQLQKAKQALDIFEKKSGLFDKNGNIENGRESYYYSKGFYELAIRDFNLAEHNFRKAIQYGYLSEGYKGLLSVYREKCNMDSVVPKIRN